MLLSEPHRSCLQALTIKAARRICRLPFIDRLIRLLHGLIFVKLSLFVPVSFFVIIFEEHSEPFLLIVPLHELDIAQIIHATLHLSELVHYMDLPLRHVDHLNVLAPQIEQLKHVVEALLQRFQT